jgi:alpha-galactosidase
MGHLQSAMMMKPIMSKLATSRLLLGLLGAALAALPAPSAAERHWDAVIRELPQPVVRLVSGLTVCDEGLRGGRWVNRYWDSTGVIKRDSLAEAEMTSILSLPVDAFELAVEGQDLAGSWQWVKAEKTTVQNPDGLLVTVELVSKSRPVVVKLRTLLHGGPVMVRWLEIANTGLKPTAITRVSPWSGVLWNTPQYPERIEKGSEAAFEIATTEYQDSEREGAWRTEWLGNSAKVISGTRGRSGFGHPTFFARNRGSGEWFVASLGWSGNWSMRLTSANDRNRGRARFFFTLGPAAADPALRVLAPGETVRSPETHLLCMRGDLDQVTQALHEHVRRNVVLPPIPGREYQVESNHRGYIIDHEDEAGLKREIDLAAEAGAEEFLIDAGWYGPQPNVWSANVGDWYAGAWLPNDLNPVREYARSKSMLFGLWVELESIGRASKLLQQHPDWVMTRDGRPVGGGRQLDFSKPEVAAWAEAEIVRLIRKYDLDMFRLDYNTIAEEGGNRVVDGFVENSLWRHVEALYAMFDRVHQRFPNVILQNCASGGGRLDFGILRRFHNTELSDWLRAPRDLKIFNGMTWILPPEILLRTFGTETDGLEADGDLDLQLRQALMARPIFRGISPTLDELNPLVRKRIRDAVEQFKKTLRPIMVGSRVYHHTPATPLLEGSPWMVMEYATPDRRRAVGWLFRTAQSGQPVFVFHPRGLDFSRTYRVLVGNSAQSIEISGDRLLQHGIPVRLESNLTSEMLLFESRE